METALHAYVLEQFDKTSLTYQQIADGADVAVRTVEKIARKEIADPGVSHIEKLAAFFRSAEIRAA